MHTFTRNWQLLFLNQWKRENDIRKYFTINLHERMLPGLAANPRPPDHQSDITYMTFFVYHTTLSWRNKKSTFTEEKKSLSRYDFRFNDTSTHDGHLLELCRWMKLECISKFWHLHEVMYHGENCTFLLILQQRPRQVSTFHQPDQTFSFIETILAPKWGIPKINFYMKSYVVGIHSKLLTEWIQTTFLLEIREIF